VAFRRQVEAMYEAGARVFVESGPGRVLTQLVGKILGDRPHVAVACDVPGDHGIRRFLLALAELAAHGVPVDAAVLFDGRDAAVVDPAAPPARAPYLLDGSRVRTADGERVPGSLPPAHDFPPISLAAAPPAVGGDDPQALVAEYLRGMQQIVAAERDVVLAALGAPPSASVPAVQAPVIEATAVAAAPGAPATLPAASPAIAVVAPEALLETIVAIVSERTGYPVEMLDPDLDLEAELSIDSIKRIEILGELAERVGLPGMDESGVDESVIEELALIKTLRGIVDWVDEHRDDAALAHAPAPGAAVAGASAATGGPPVLAPEALLETIVAIVSERTGYPVEMLDPDLDLEAELSIDSIKRIEILGELAERVGLPGMDESGVDESVIEELALIKTLRGIVDWVEDHRDLAPGTGATVGGAASGAAGDVVASGAGVGEHAGPAGPTAGAAGPGSGGHAPGPAPSPLARYVPALVEAPPADADHALSGTAVVVVDGGTEVGGRLLDLLAAAGAAASVIAPEDVAGALRAAEGAGEPHTLVDLGALAPVADVTRAVVGQFERLRAAAQAGVPRLVVVTGQGGTLGHGGPAGDAAGVAVAGAAQGMVRTFARELPGVASRLVDVDPAEGAAAVAAHVLAELRGAGAPTEVGRTAAGRRVLSTVARPLDVDAGIEAGIGEDRDLGAGSVVVVTGGARGIGARLAVALARTSGCGIELIGRSPLPGPEPADLAGAADEVAVRQAVIRRGQHTRPADIEAATARALADREIRATLAALAEHAAFLDYRSLDVRDTAALAGALDAIREQRGRLDGVVHAAGVREDKLIRDKQPESFARVFDTKVGAARVIADAVGERGFAVFFASVSGWFGNAGQVDYAAANSVLDAVARQARRTAPGSRILAIDWGPWAGAGMVSPELAREYSRRGIGLVDPDEGVAAALAELRAGVPDPQVVVMCAAPEQSGA
jgi:NAD(P)-dependent dehydrogenase (short-subunit alcohol dehydrogenase family)/acyl carrier protein